MEENEGLTLLAPIAAMLESDGYGLSVKVSDTVIDISILATPAACDECLVPRPVMEGIIRDALGEERLAADGRQLIVRYPNE